MGPSDAEAVARLMLDAYRGTIDSEGEDLDGARAEVASFLIAGESSSPRLAESFLVRSGEELVSACLVANWPRRGCPIVSYVLTAPAAKRQGMGSVALAASIEALAASGESEVRAIITEGNEPSERLFARFGFLRLPKA
jgi:RimJ/RimL family protein N-acetyltransferase